MMNETQLSDSWNPVPHESRHSPWRDSLMSHATSSDATQSAMSATAFSNVTVYPSRATTCGMTQLLVASSSVN
jgi:hypothetical protein